MKLFLVIFSIQISTILSSINFQPQIRFPHGTLMGEQGQSHKGRSFYKFWCIPFGKSERFEPAEPSDPWEGVLDATSCSKRCYQIAIPGMNELMSAFPQDEDCLVLNVFMPAKPKEIGLLPVLVWIHGGYFVAGSGLEYSAEMFMDEDIVMVTINYRLGAMGFLTSDDGFMDGNLGMKDQVLSLEWVKTFIHHFRGDPNRVTIMGESAGGASIGLLLLSPLANGLFNYAIAHSGSSITPFAFQSKPAENFQGVVAELNCTAPTTEEAVACLKTKEPEEICEIVGKSKWFADFLYPMFPSVETATPKNSKKFLPNHPREMLKGGYFSHVPLIIGVVEDEGAFQGGLAINDDDFIEDLNTKWIPIGGIANGVDNKNISKENLDAGLMKLRKFYFNDETLDLSHAQKLIDMFSDSWFITGMDYTIRHHSKYAPVYPYLFTKKGGIPLSGMLVGSVLNRSVVSHGEELQYLFFRGFASADHDIHTIFRTLYQAMELFYCDGLISVLLSRKPTGTWGSRKVWPQAPTDTWDYMYYILDDDTSAVMNPFKERVQFRDQLEENEFNELNNKNSV